MRIDDKNTSWSNYGWFMIYSAIVKLYFIIEFCDPNRWLLIIIHTSINIVNSIMKFLWSLSSTFKEKVEIITVFFKEILDTFN